MNCKVCEVEMVGSEKSANAKLCNFCFRTMPGGILFCIEQQNYTYVDVYDHIEYNKNNYKKHPIYVHRMQMLGKDLKKCPRCKTEMNKIKTSGILYSAVEETIDKCFNCGYC